MNQSPSNATSAAAKTLDASGLNCPLPILKAKKAIAELASGELLHVIATDPGSVADFASFCKQTGNTLVASRQSGSSYEFDIRKS